MGTNDPNWSWTDTVEHLVADHEFNDGWQEPQQWRILGADADKFATSVHLDDHDDQGSKASHTHDPDEPVPFKMADPGPYPHDGNGTLLGYVAGWCGHKVARSEWRAGSRVCERCPKQEPPKVRYL